MDKVQTSSVFQSSEVAARNGWETAQPKSEQASKNIPSGELHCQMQICSVRLMSTSSAVSWGSSLPLAHASFTEICRAKLNSVACDFLEDVHLPQTAWAAPGPRWQLRRRNCRVPREQHCPTQHTLQQCQEQLSSRPRHKGHNARVLHPYLSLSLTLRNTVRIF